MQVQKSSTCARYHRRTGTLQTDPGKGSNQEDVPGELGSGRCPTQLVILAVVPLLRLLLRYTISRIKITPETNALYHTAHSQPSKRTVMNQKGKKNFTEFFEYRENKGIICISSIQAVCFQDEKNLDFFFSLFVCPLVNTATVY